MDTVARLRELPSVDSLLDSPDGQRLQRSYGRKLLKTQLRSCLQELRHKIRAGSGTTIAVEIDTKNILEQVERFLQVDAKPSLLPLINATGILVHTNLGRAPLAAAAIKAVSEVAQGYSSLEFDLASGKRGSRNSHIEAALCELTGAEAALVVNNCAAAIILALAAHGADAEVVVSRGELVEIGGAFRMPDVIAQSGATMREVGTTNRTRIEDYRAAISDKTTVLLSSHPSNYRVMGFTEQVPLSALCELAHEHDVLCIQDLGSGALTDPGIGADRAQFSVSASLAAGVDLITFSGDKLLGGPQAGIILGSRKAIAPLRRHPLHRAMRIDKLSLAALHATVRLYLEGKEQEIPIHAMLNTPQSVLHARAEKLLSLITDISGLQVRIDEDDAYAGGGAMPAEAIPSWAVVLEHESLSVNQLQSALRTSEPPIIARVQNNELRINTLTVSDEQLSILKEAIKRVSECRDS